jgi:hypothetical protein
MCLAGLSAFGLLALLLPQARRQYRGSINVAIPNAEAEAAVETVRQPRHSQAVVSPSGWFGSIGSALF